MISLFNIEGKALIEIKAVGKSEYELNISGLEREFFIIRIMNKKQVISKDVLIH